MADRFLARVSPPDGATIPRDNSFAIEQGMRLSVVEGSADLRLVMSAQAANWAMRQNDLERAGALFERSREWSRALGDTRQAALAILGFGESLMFQGDESRGVAFVEESIAQLRKAGHVWEFGVALANYAYSLLLVTLDEERASALATEALGCYQIDLSRCALFA